MTIDPQYYSPNGDGKKDTTTIRPIIYDTKGIVRWSGSAASDNNRVVASTGGEGAPPAAMVLGGTDEQGNVAPDGFYTISMTVEYENGYRAVASDPAYRVRIDRVPPDIRITVNEPLIFHLTVTD